LLESLEFLKKARLGEDN
jgi:hypothetical protein